jgi:hypothetical protein
MIPSANMQKITPIIGDSLSHPSITDKVRMNHIRIFIAADTHKLQDLNRSSVCSCSTSDSLDFDVLEAAAKHTTAQVDSPLGIALPLRVAQALHRFADKWRIQQAMQLRL